MREASGHAVGDHGDSADSQRGNAIQSSDGKRAALGQRSGIWRTAGTEVFLEYRQLATFDVQPVDDHRIVVVVNLQHEVRGAGITIGVMQGVGEGFGAIAATMQRLEIRVAGVQRVGVGAVGIQHQRAIGPGERTGDHRATVGAGRNAVGALHVVGQDAAGQGQQGFRSRARIAVIDGFGHVIGDVDVQRAGRRVAVAVARNHREMFAEAVGTVARRMGVVSVEGVAVADRAVRRVVTGDGQGVAQLRGDRLRETDRDTADDHANAADAQARQTIGRRDAEAAGLGQRAGIGGGAIRQIGFVERQFAPEHIEACEGHKVVDRWRDDRRRRVVAVVDDRVVAFFRKLGNATETGRGETDDRIDPATHFGQQHKTVAATLAAIGITRGIGACGGGFSGFGRVLTGGNGFLDLGHVGELGIARGQRFRGIHMGCVVGQQLSGQGQAAVPAQGQFLAVLQMDGNRPLRPGDQLIPGKQPIAFHQWAPTSVCRLSENLTNDFGDDPDERCHVHFLRCRPPSALVREAAHGSSGLSGRRSHLDSSFRRLCTFRNSSALRHLESLIDAARPLALRNGGESPE